MSNLQLTIVLIPLIVSLILLLTRFFLGPGNLDRLVSFESITIVMICLFGYIGMVYQTEWFFDALLVLSLIGFLSTIAVSLHMKKSEGNT